MSLLLDREVIPPPSQKMPSKGSRFHRLLNLARLITFNRIHLLVVTATLLVFALAFVVGYLLRFEFVIPDSQSEFMLRMMPMVVMVKLIAFYFSGIYRILWAYIGIWDLFRILRATAMASGSLLITLFLLERAILIPRSVLVLDGVLTFLGVGGAYAILKWIREFDGRKNSARRASEPVLIIGAGDAGESLLRELLRNPLAGVKVVGFLDDSPQKQGQSLRGIPILGRIDKVSGIAYRYRVKKAYVAIPSANGMLLKRIMGYLLAAGVVAKVLPPIAQLTGKNSYLPQLREVSIEDLLRRDPIKLDDAGISSFVRDKVVLVTGAAGSIGSELCRQILRYDPAKLIALDCAESPLHSLLLELQSDSSKCEIRPALADVTDAACMSALFEVHHPQVVFHAAALKHVPLLEGHPREAIQVNVKGTRIVAETAKRFKTSAFVLISTDKAVNPSSVMGATKRVAELIINQLQESAESTRYMVVRFGNVLGSNGSVLPIFKAQLARGGPITVTHPDMQRFFMTIPEAVQLVLQAAELGKGGEVFVLDMGQPVRIVDMAEDLIRLSGLLPGVDVNVAFTGIRPGEKLFEELRHDSESLEKTAHPQVFCVRMSNCETDRMKLAKLEQLADDAYTPEEIIRGLRLAVPEFRPS